MKFNVTELATRWNSIIITHSSGIPYEWTCHSWAETVGYCQSPQVCRVSYGLVRGFWEGPGSQEDIEDGLGSF